MSEVLKSDGGNDEWENLLSGIDARDDLAAREIDLSREKKLEKGIKIVIGGPPHSGKSVFIQALKQLLGDDCYQLQAAPDGEGDWYHANYQDTEVRAMRDKNKGIFTDEFVAQKAKQVADWADTPVTLIDIGGKIDDKNAQIIQGATHAIVLAGSGRDNDRHSIEELETWSQFFEDNDLEVIGKIHSEYDPSAADLQVAGASDGHVTGRVHYLERGENLRERDTIQELAELICQMADNNTAYQRAHEEGKFSSVVRVDKLLEDLPGKTTEIRLKSGRVTGTTKWLLPEAVPEIYKKVAADYADNEHPMLNGGTANWGAVAIAMAFHEQGANYIGMNSPDGMVLTEPLQQSAEPDARWWETPRMVGEQDGRPIIEVHSKVNYSNNPFAPADLADLRIPEVPAGAFIVVSGAIPQWLAASVTMGYSETAAAVAIRGIGQGDIVAWAQDKKYLGRNLASNQTWR